jgi:hypothetical protein
MKHVAVAGLLCVAYVLGQAAPWGDGLKFVSELGVLGVLVWYLWHTNTKTLPQKDKAFAEEAERQRQHSSQQLDIVVQEMQADRAAAQQGLEKVASDLAAVRVQCERRGGD